MCKDEWCSSQTVFLYLYSDDTGIGSLDTCCSDGSPSHDVSLACAVVSAALQ